MPRDHIDFDIITLCLGRKPCGPDSIAGPLPRPLSKESPVLKGFTIRLPKVPLNGTCCVVIHQTPLDLTSRATLDTFASHKSGSSPPRSNSHSWKKLLIFNNSVDLLSPYEPCLQHDPRRPFKQPLVDPPACFSVFTWKAAPQYPLRNKTIPVLHSTGKQTCREGHKKLSKKKMI